MALTKADLEAIGAIVAQAAAAAVTAALAQPVVAAPKPAAKASSRFVDEVIRGQHACTATPPCGRVLKTAKRAAVHGSEGHFAAK